MAQPKQVREIRILVDTKGAAGMKDLAASMDRVSKSVKKTAKDVGTLKTAFLAIQGFNIGGAGLSGIVQFSDSIQLLADRVGQIEGSSAGAIGIVEKLSDVASQTGTRVTSLAESYTRLGLALSDIGIKGDALIGVTKLLQQTFRLSGATIAEATGATIQLSQGLASGQLRGQELRSVLESNVVIGGILAKQLGVTRGQLLKFAEKEGGIKAEEVLKALANSSADLNIQAQKLGFTMEQTLGAAANSLQVQVLKLNKAFGLSEGFNAVVMFAVDNALPGLSLAIGALAASQYPAFTAAVIKANIALKAFLLSGTSISIALTSAAQSLGAFIASAAPLAAVAATVSYLAYAFIDFESWVNVTIKSLSGLGFLFAWVAEKGGELAVWVAKLTGVGGELAQDFKDWGTSLKNDFVKAIEDSSNSLRRSNKEAVNYDRALQQTLKTMQSNKSKGQINDIKSLNLAYSEGVVNLSEYNKKLLQLQTEEVEKRFRNGQITLKQYNEEIKKLNEGTKAIIKNDFQKQVAALNAQFAKNGDLKAYAEAMDDLNAEKMAKDFNIGALSVTAYKKSLLDLDAKEIARNFNEGRISYMEFDEAIKNNSLQKLNMDLATGNIELAEYYANLNKISNEFNADSAFYQGVSDAIKNMGTLSSNVAGAITNTFSTLEDSLVEFTKNGKFNFKNFANAVLEDLNRIIIRSLIIRPLAQGILGYFKGGAASAGGGGAGAGLSGLSGPSVMSPNTNAKGGAFSGGVKFFAQGGVVDGATPFRFGNNLGVMGEAGPEAILPLERTSNGDLGVKASSPIVNVNIINNAGVEIQQSESTNENGQRSIEILILGTVKDGFAKGSFDRSLQASYGLTRRGI